MDEVFGVRPQDILSFWRDAGEERWYRKDAAFDEAIRARYLEVWEQASAGKLSSWETSDEGALALVIVLDQFPRNMFRDDTKTYCSDALAREVASRAIARGADSRVDAALRDFSICRSCIRKSYPTNSIASISSANPATPKT
jgi:uncharacterized protein (DUF924 family)